MNCTRAVIYFWYFFFVGCGKCMVCGMRGEKREKKRVIQTIAVLVARKGTLEKNRPSPTAVLQRNLSKNGRKIVKINEIKETNKGLQRFREELVVIVYFVHHCKNTGKRTKTATTQQWRQCRHHRHEGTKCMDPSWRNLEKGRLDHGSIAQLLLITDSKHLSGFRTLGLTDWVYQAAARHARGGSRSIKHHRLAVQ